MPKFYAEPRHYPDGALPNALFTFSKDGGLDLEGWYVCLKDDAEPHAIPTERETVAAIFRYVLDRYTNRNEIELGDEFEALGEGGLLNDYEIPQGAVLGFDRN